MVDLGLVKCILIKTVYRNRITCYVFHIKLHEGNLFVAKLVYFVLNLCIANLSFMRTPILGRVSLFKKYRNRIIFLMLNFEVPMAFILDSLNL